MLARMLARGSRVRFIPYHYIVDHVSTEVPAHRAVEYGLAVPRLCGYGSTFVAAMHAPARRARRRRAPTRDGTVRPR